MRSLSLSLLICAALASSAAFGQSLSIIKGGESNYWIEASAPANNPQTLQASANLHLWADILDPVQGQYSSQLDGMAVAQRYFRLVPSAPPAPPIVVMLLGDSTTADYTGWGGGMYGYFKPNATVVNYAMPADSTSEFLQQSDELDKMLLVEPNDVLIAYGLVDASSGDPDRFTTLEEFQTNLVTICQIVRGFQGVPILVTLLATRNFDESGMVSPLFPDRTAVIKEVAAELQTPLIDLSQLSVDLFNQLGPSGTQFMNYSSSDHVHLSPAGAVIVARLVVNALPDALGPYLTGIFDPPPVP
jgi:lysophospholipase L1-like esterase